jgi:hypothetical protein
VEFSHGEILGGLGILALAALAAAAAVFGVHEIVVDPEASPAFLRAADPTRPLPGASPDSCGDRDASDA